MGVRHANGERGLTGEELAQRVAQATTGLASLGVQAGDGVALMLRNDIAFFEAAMAAGQLGAYAAPINWHYKGDEAGYIVRDCQAKALVVHADLLPQIVGDVPFELPVLVVETPFGVRAAYGIDAASARVPPERIDWDEWVDSQAAWREPPKVAPQSQIYTSGTTGRPKGVRREPMTPGQQAANLAAYRTVFGIEPSMRTVVTGPLYHSAPNGYALTAARSGGDVILQPRFDAEELLRLIEQEQVTHLHMVPTMFVRLLKLPEEVRARHDIASLRHVVHAAAPCPVEVKRAMIDWWGPVIHEYYGATETGAVVFCDSAEWLAHPGTVGRPLEGATVRVYGEQGELLPPGEIGELYMRADHVADFTYHGRDEARAEIERDGLVTVGDVGYFDRDGYLHLCDRKKDMVISGGVNIYPAEIEAVLVTMPGVRDCAVFGVPDGEMGENVAAVVEPQGGADLSADEVRRFLRDRIAHYKVPKLIEFQTDLPREDSGKIFKRRIRERYWESAGRRI
ncbi:acyl-CoA synthetase [Desertibaculum subflavum]|uniref:acyl-CoA synthetase n=1 Tax=Desertibaculum subflavum TaxID=2268458 RepID=UPI000E663C9B